MILLLSIFQDEDEGQIHLEFGEWDRQIRHQILGFYTGLSVFSLSVSSSSCQHLPKPSYSSYDYCDGLRSCLKTAYHNDGKLLLPALSSTHFCPSASSSLTFCLLYWIPISYFLPSWLAIPSLPQIWWLFIPYSLILLLIHPNYPTPS